MLNKFIAALFGLILACCASNGVTMPDASIIPDRIFSEPFSTYVFGYSKNNRFYGHAFICNNKILTSKHLADKENCRYYDRDVSVIGDSTIRGLEICDDCQWHDRGFVYYFAERGHVLGYITSQCDKRYMVDTIQMSHYGDSGLPVMCVAHERAIGIMSSIMPSKDDVYHIIVAKLYLTDVYEAPKDISAIGILDK